MVNLITSVNVSTEWDLEGQVHRENPYGEIEVVAILEAADGTQTTLPLFWSGGQVWTLRVSVAVAGEYSLRSKCSDTKDLGLNGLNAQLLVTNKHLDSNPLFHHGAVRVKQGAGFVHADGTPFFWLGDTWWMQMSDRVSWPNDFTTLVQDRAEHGFTVVQVVLGYPGDLATDDPRVGNEGGMPLATDRSRINPAYFEACDRRLRTIIRAGIVPCILGSWGYHLLELGEKTMTDFWRYLVARYASWPVVWALAGETAMSYYLSKDPAGDTERLRSAWTRVSQVVKHFDPYHRPLSTHPRRSSWLDLEDSTTLDFHMLQPGHMRNALGLGVSLIEDARKSFPEQPVVNAEPPYEGHMGTNGPEVQRFAFWSSLLSGAGGFTYGSAGIFQANDRDRPTGNRPDGGAYDATTWDEALTFKGASQLGKARALLEKLPWQDFKPFPEWATTAVRWGEEAYDPPLRVYCAGVPNICRLFYIPRRYWHWDGTVLHCLEPGTRYQAQFVDPERFTTIDAGVALADSKGDWVVPTTPYLMEWLLLLKRL